MYSKIVFVDKGQPYRHYFIYYLLEMLDKLNSGVWFVSFSIWVYTVFKRYPGTYCKSVECNIVVSFVATLKNWKYYLNIRITNFKCTHLLYNFRQLMCSQSDSYTWKHPGYWYRSGHSHLMIRHIHWCLANKTTMLY